MIKNKIHQKVWKKQNFLTYQNDRCFKSTLQGTMFSEEPLPSGFRKLLTKGTFSSLFFSSSKSPDWVREDIMKRSIIHQTSDKKPKILNNKNFSNESAFKQTKTEQSTIVEKLNIPTHWNNERQPKVPNKSEPTPPANAVLKPKRHYKCS